MNECRGEDVSRMTSVPEIGIQMALNKAAFSGDTLTLEKLLKLNTWIDFYSKDCQSALMKAAQGGKSNSMKFLINNGADINLKDAKDNTALHHLAKSIQAKNAEALETLISSGAKLEIRNCESDTPPLVASKNLNLIGAKLLIKAKANFNFRDVKGETILFSFVRRGDFAAVNELISLCVDASIKNH